MVVARVLVSHAPTSILADYESRLGAAPSVLDTFERNRAQQQQQQQQQEILAPRDEAPAFALAAAAPQVLPPPYDKQYFPEPGVDPGCLYSKFKKLSEFLRPEIEAHVCASEGRTKTHIPSQGLASAHLDSPDTLVMLWHKTKLPLPRGVTSLMLDTAIHEQGMDTLEQLGHWLHVWERDSLAGNSQRRELAYVGFTAREVDLALADAAMEETQLDPAAAELAWGLHHRNDGMDKLIGWVQAYRNYQQTTRAGTTSVVEALRALNYPPFLVRACVRKRMQFGRVKGAINLDSLDACIDWINAENRAYRRVLAKRGETKLLQVNDKEYERLMEKAHVQELKDTSKQRKKEEKQRKKQSKKKGNADKVAAAEAAAAAREEEELAMVRARIAAAKLKEERREFAHLAAPDEKPHLAALTRGHLLATDDPAFEPPLVQTRQQYDAQLGLQDDPTPAPHLQESTHRTAAPLFSSSPRVLSSYEAQNRRFSSLPPPPYRGSMLLPTPPSPYMADEAPEDLCGLRDRLLRDSNKARARMGLPQEEKAKRVATWRAGHGARAQGGSEHAALLDKARTLKRPDGMTWLMVRTQTERMRWRSLNDVETFFEGWQKGRYVKLPLETGMAYLGYPEQAVAHALYRMGSTTKGLDAGTAQKLWRDQHRRDPFDHLINWLAEYDGMHARCAAGQSTTVEALRRLGYPAGLVDEVAKGPAHKRRTLAAAVAEVERLNKVLNAFIKKKGDRKMQKMSKQQYAMWFAKIEKQEAKKEAKAAKKEAKRRSRTRASSAEERRRSEANRNQGRVAEAARELSEEEQLKKALAESMRQFEQEKRAVEERMRDQRDRLRQEREEEERLKQQRRDQFAEQLASQRAEQEQEKREREERLRSEKRRAEQRMQDEYAARSQLQAEQEEQRRAAQEADQTQQRIQAYISQHYGLTSDWGIGFKGPRLFFMHHSSQSTQWEDPRMSDWMELVDPRNGKTYFQNNRTRQTTYEDPRGHVQLPRSQEELDTVIAIFLSGRGEEATSKAQADSRAQAQRVMDRERAVREAAERRRDAANRERLEKAERELRERAQARQDELAAERAKLAAFASEQQAEARQQTALQGLNRYITEYYQLPADWGVGFQGDRLLFMNHATKKTQWTDPRLDGWVKLIDNRNGRPYFQNNLTRQTTYQDPSSSNKVPANKQELARVQQEYMARQ